MVLLAPGAGRAGVAQLTPTGEWLGGGGGQRPAEWRQPHPCADPLARPPALLPTHQGVDGGDVDLPTRFEAKWVTNRFAKAIFNFFYLCIYGARPLLVRPKPFSLPDAVNWALVVPFDLAVLYFWGWKSFVYLLAGAILGGGPHPMAGHLLAEHYMFEPGQETYSYYGPLNLLSYNVGYHNEHHDFPQIPHTRLHKVAMGGDQGGACPPSGARRALPTYLFTHPSRSPTPCPCCSCARWPPSTTATCAATPPGCGCSGNSWSILRWDPGAASTASAARAPPRPTPPLSPLAARRACAWTPPPPALPRPPPSRSRTGWPPPRAGSRPGAAPAGTARTLPRATEGLGGWRGSQDADLLPCAPLG